MNIPMSQREFRCMSLCGTRCLPTNVVVMDTKMVAMITCETVSQFKHLSAKKNRINMRSYSQDGVHLWYVR